MVTYLYNNGILFVQFKGSLKLSDILNHIKEFSEFDFFPNKALLIYDLLNCELILKPDEIKDLSLAGELSTEKYSIVRTALIVDQPKSNAFTTLYALLAKQKKTKRKVFTTKEEALRWINSFKD